MKRIKSILIIVALGVLLFPQKAESSMKTKVCPNSSVKCNVTFTTEEHGEITVESEKGKNDSAIVVE
jgi:hypothetical protein